MPIRFRCAYCNQLLGIARRKAGTVVRCPTCAGQVVVPAGDGGDEEEEKPPGRPPVFERSDFDDLFNNAPAGGGDDPRTAGAAPSGTAAGTAAPPAGGAWGTHADPDVEAEPLGLPSDGAAPGFQPPRTPGLVLSPAKATIL